MTDIEIRVEEHSGIRTWWVRLRGEPLRFCGEVDHCTRDEAIATAHLLAERARRVESAERRLRDRHPGKPLFLFQGECPTDIDPKTWPEGVSAFMAVFALRRRGGLERIADYEKIEEG